MISDGVVEVQWEGSASNEIPCLVLTISNLMDKFMIAAAIDLLLAPHKCTVECKSVNGNVCHDKSTISKPPCRI